MIWQILSALAVLIAIILAYLAGKTKGKEHAEEIIRAYKTALPQAIMDSRITQIFGLHIAETINSQAFDKVLQEKISHIPLNSGSITHNALRAGDEQCANPATW